jgi:Domain of unknown function (DUF4124)
VLVPSALRAPAPVNFGVMPLNMRYLTAILLAISANSSTAAIYKCSTADGKIEYQASPCQSGKTSSLAVNSSQSTNEGPTFPPRPDSQQPEVIGDSRFRSRAYEALALLKSRDSGAHAIVSGYVGRIEQSTHSGMNASADPPTFHMSDATAMYSVTWAAASISHDAYHSKLYHDFKGAHPDAPVPADAWSGTGAEIKCNKFQVAVMRRIGAPQEEIDHALVNSDGHYIGQEVSRRKY